ncbi:hypothetical protein GOV06_03875 [Candidatus Woesearchaeota archaeon]|nr:hypothetical protein [Candidatus Woesearchaeota archaeon]
MDILKYVKGDKSIENQEEMDRVVVYIDGQVKDLLAKKTGLIHELIDQIQDLIRAWQMARMFQAEAEALSKEFRKDVEPLLDKLNELNVRHNEKTLDAISKELTKFKAFYERIIKPKLQPSHQKNVEGGLRRIVDIIMALTGNLSNERDLLEKKKTLLRVSLRITRKEL